jgi:hypothetical protein
VAADSTLAMQKLRIVTFGGTSGGGSIAHGAVTRRPPISLYTMVRGYAHDVGVWDLSVAQGAFSVAPCQKPKESRFANFASL